jgi:dipeptidyl aminopeptidase/acylaminoacyl peptidase
MSAAGLLAYWDGTTVSTGWEWLDRLGNPLPAVPVPTTTFGGVRLAPADGRVAYVARQGESEPHVWLMESTGRTSRFTFAGGGASYPVWSRDAREILFTSIVDGVTAVFRQPTSGQERERLIAMLPGSAGIGLGEFRVADWSRDRRHALLGVAEGGTGRDIALLSVDTGEISPLIHTRATEVQARLSPDGRWIAYASDDTGRWEVFVEPVVRGSVTPSQVSRNGGSQPIWRANGEELYFLAPDGKLMSVAVRTGVTFSHDTPRPLFQTRMRPTYPPYPVDYDVTSDAQRFLINAARPGTGPVLSIVSNWSELLKQDP